MYKVTLPWPPTVNTYYTVARGRKILSSKGRNYKKACAIILSQNKGYIDGAIGVFIEAHYPDRRKRDLDNILKPVLDALTDGGIYNDDSQIEALGIRKSDYGEKGTIIVTVKELENV